MKMFRFKQMLTGIIIFLLPLIVLSQSFILQDPPSSNPKMTFKYFRPHFKGLDNPLSVLSGLYDFNVSIPVNDRINIIGSVPFAAIGGEDFVESESTLANISAGIQYRFGYTDQRATAVTLSITAPTASENKIIPLLLGMMSDYYEVPKFFPNVLTINGNLSHHIFRTNGFLLNMEIGPYLMIPTKSDNNSTLEDTELFVHYGVSVGYRLNPITLNVELAGLGIITEDMDNFEDRFDHMLAFGVQWNRGSVRPGLYYQLFLDKDMNDTVNGVLGLKLEIDLSK